MFDSSVHLFAMNNLVNLHNQKMLKLLNYPIARCVAKRSSRTYIIDCDDDVLEREVLLFRGEHVMLICNLWVEAGLVNGALGYIENIFFVPSSKPPKLPQFVTTMFEKYHGVPFDSDYPILVLISPVVRGNMRNFPLKMAWPLPIHKS